MLGVRGRIKVPMKAGDSRANPSLRQRQVRAHGEVWALRQVLRELGQGDLDGFVALRFASVGEVLRGDFHLDVRVCAVVLHSTTDVFKPEGELQLRGYAAVRQGVARGDADVCKKC